METYTPTRPIMTSAELRSHHTSAHGRDYTQSGDGYDDMELNEKKGWRSISSWGRDGWDLGDWPYVVISVGERGDTFLMQTVVEGDHDRYEFTSAADRDAGVDYLFIWYGIGKEYDGWIVEGLTPDKRQALDAGTLRVPAEFRGPFSWERLGAETP